MKNVGSFVIDMMPSETLELVARATFDPSVGAIRLWLDDGSYTVIASEVPLADMMVDGKAGKS